MKAILKDRFFLVFLVLVTSLTVATASGREGAQTAATTTPQSSLASKQGEVTFTKDVAPILQRSCQTCHRPDSIAPMSLLTYEDARPWAKAIRENVLKRNMPPWHIDPNIGIQDFTNNIALSDQEISTI